MGCGGSKVDDLPLVTLCRERRDFVRAASHRRADLAAAHLSYFQSLRHVGDALRKFSDEELAFLSASVPGSPLLTLPSDEGKPRRKAPIEGEDRKSAASSSVSIEEEEGEDEGAEGSHLHLSDSDSESDLNSGLGHVRVEESSKLGTGNYPNYHPYPPPGQGFYGFGDWAPLPGGVGMNSNSNSTSYVYYSKRSETKMNSMVYEEPETERYSSWYQQNNFGGGGGFYGFLMGSPSGSPPQKEDDRRGQPGSDPAPEPPPSPPKVSTWDFLNFFDSYDSGGYEMNYPGTRYGYGSNVSSPNSSEVREREGIPDLEDETDPEALKVRRRRRKSITNDYWYDDAQRNVNSGEGTSSSRSVPKQRKSNEGRTEIPESAQNAEMKSSSGTVETGATSASKIPEEELTRKKGVSFETEEAQSLEVESSKRSSLVALSVHRTRDLQEVVKEIRDEFEVASGYGKEVAVLLEVGKLPYQPRVTALKVIFSRILYLIAPSMLCSSYSTSPSRPSVRLSSQTMKMAKEYGVESGKKLKSLNLSSTLDKLYAWEKKLHKEVRDEERLRVIYEKQCKRLRYLDEHGAESGKIDAIQASVRKSLTKINVCIKAVEVISTRIHKLRDEELMPQVTELIHGLIRMWKSMLKCHQKQFQAIMESKMHKLNGNKGLHRDTALKATAELEMELLNWCSCFNTWINTQKSYVESLHEWLSRCILEEPEETDDGFAPFSPTRAGAPPIFTICNDWVQAMERISEKKVSNAMSDFAVMLHQLWERQDDEHRHRVKAEFLSKDFEKRLGNLRAERGKLEQDRIAVSSDKTALSRVSSGSGISPLDDLKVDLDSMRNKLAEERARHKEAIKLVQDAASNSLQAGLTPIFEALGSFTSEALKAHEEVRLQNSG